MHPQLQAMDVDAVTGSQALPGPGVLRRVFPLTQRAEGTVAEARRAAAAIVAGHDDRLLVVVGPCSIHDPVSARHYADALVELSARHADELLILMRTYFEKPRTTLGWKGYVNDPHLDGSCDIGAGLRGARALLSAITDGGLPVATELLDPLVAEYLGDFVSWAAIGARTSESQVHRELASGLPNPVGFKNATDGGLTGALCAIAAAAAPHTRLSVDATGATCVARTAGNRAGHLVLRGGRSGPNYAPAQVRAACAAALQRGVAPRVMVDCSHDNSGKQPHRQPAVLADVAAQVAAGEQAIMGVMLESHVVAGQQALAPGKALTYGQSITDGCIDLGDTATCLRRLSDAVLARRGPTVRS